MFSLLGKFAVGQNGVRDLVLGISIQTVVFVITGGIIQTYGYESQFGTLSFVYISRVNRLVNYLSRMILHIPNVVPIMFFSLLSANIIANLDFGSVNWAGFILSVSLVTFSIAGFAQSIGVFTGVVFKHWVNVIWLPQGLLLAFTGAVIPIAVFPEALQELFKLLPGTNGLFAIRASFVGVQVSELSNFILRELLTGVGYCAIGALGFLVVERLAKRNGVLNLSS